MQWLQSVFGSDGSPVVQYITIFAVIFAVLAVIVLVVRRFGGGGLVDAKRSGQRGRQPRLGIVDVYELDRQRQLILLRRDNVEHLLLVGGPNDVVIERHIQRGQPRDPGSRPEAMAEPFVEPGSDAFQSLATQAEASFRPDFTMPIVLAPSMSGQGAGVPLFPSPEIPSPEIPRPEIPLQEAAFLDAEPRGDRASEAVVAGLRPDAPARRPMRRTAPPLINPRPDVASERARAEAAPEEPAFAAGAMPPILPLAPAERRTVDPAILSDMARQLEAALARPASAVTPSAARPAPSFATPAPVAAPVPDAPSAVDPMAAAMATPVDPPVGPGTTSEAVPVEAAAPPPVRSEPAPFLPAPPPAEPAPPPAPVAVPEPPPPAPIEPAPPPPRVEPQPAPAPPPAKPAANPFSVEEIEAEFARLLGRPLDKRN